jgi:hypothetical protein
MPSSKASETDPTLRVLQRIAEVWQIDSSRIRWTEASEHLSAGFDWWPGDFCVRVRAHKRREASEGMEFKVVIRTDFLKDVAIDTDRFEKMASVSARFFTSTTLGFIHRIRFGKNSDRQTTSPCYGSVAPVTSRPTT